MTMLFTKLVRVIYSTELVAKKKGNYNVIVTESIDHRLHVIFS